jgi:hypothetical protein
VREWSLVQLKHAGTLFSYSVGARTLSALLENTADPDAADLSDFISQATPASRTAVAAWAIGEPCRLAAAVGAAELTKIDFVQFLARAQLQSTLPAAPVEHWAALARIALDSGRLSNAVSLVGFLAAVGLPDPASLELARRLFDPLFAAVRSFQLTSEESIYLEDQLSSLSRSWPLTRSVLIAAVIRWRVEGDDGGALSLSEDIEHLRDLVSATASQQGRGTLERALDSGALSAPASAVVRTYLDAWRPKSRNKPSFWWW